MNHIHTTRMPMLITNVMLKNPGNIGKTASWTRAAAQTLLLGLPPWIKWKRGNSGQYLLPVDMWVRHFCEAYAYWLNFDWLLMNSEKKKKKEKDKYVIMILFLLAVFSTSGFLVLLILFIYFFPVIRQKLFSYGIGGTQAVHTPYFVYWTIIKPSAVS